MAHVAQGMNRPQSEGIDLIEDFMDGISDDIQSLREDKPYEGGHEDKPDQNEDLSCVYENSDSSMSFTDEEDGNKDEIGVENASEDAGHISIIPINYDLKNLVSSTPGSCPLCLKKYVAPSYPSVVKRHLDRFHSKRYFVHGGLKHYICRLGCIPKAHYHCSCGMRIHMKNRAQAHVKICSKRQRSDKIPQNLNEEIYEDPHEDIHVQNRENMGENPDASTDNDNNSASDTGMTPVNSVTGHLSILPVNHTLEDLVSKKHRSCPLCLTEYYAPAFPSALKRHITRFHNENCFIHAGMKHFCCRLGCKSSRHYHTLCGKLYREKEEALNHVQICRGACKFARYVGKPPHASEYLLALVSENPKTHKKGGEKSTKTTFSTFSLDHGSYSSSTFDPESTGHISIVPINFDLENLVSKNSAPCPLCLKEHFAESCSSAVKRHITRFHCKRHFVLGGLKFYNCRLGCISGAHYHCVCGKLSHAKQKAMDHVANCVKGRKSDEIQTNLKEETMEIPEDSYEDETSQNQDLSQVDEKIGASTSFSDEESKRRDHDVECVEDRPYPDNTGHISILPINYDLKNFVSSTPGPCPLCLEDHFAPSYPSAVKRHLNRFHSKRSFVIGDLVVYMCRLGCTPEGHYHCLCGMIFRHIRRAMTHASKCKHHSEYKEKESDNPSVRNLPSPEEDEAEDQTVILAHNEVADTPAILNEEFGVNLGSLPSETTDYTTPATPQAKNMKITSSKPQSNTKKQCYICGNLFARRNLGRHEQTHQNPVKKGPKGPRKRPASEGLESTSSQEEANVLEFTAYEISEEPSDMEVVEETSHASEDTQILSIDNNELKLQIGGRFVIVQLGC